MDTLTDITVGNIIEIWALSPVGMMRAAGFEPDEWQKHVLRSQSDRILLLCGRQMGKSTCVACLALHKAMFTPDSLSLLIAPTERQSKELFDKILPIYYRLGQPTATASDPTATALKLANGSRIVTLPGDPETLRAFSAVDLAIIDEAARVKVNMLPAILPMLAVSRGRMILLSTPKGRQGFFFDLWQKSGTRWEKIRARASECPRLDPTFLAEFREEQGEAMYLQEYENEFISSGEQVFSENSVDDAFSSSRSAMAW